METKFEHHERTLTCTMTGTVKEFELLYAIMALNQTVPAALKTQEQEDYVISFMSHLHKQLKEVLFQVEGRA
jgi:hypothetical protein